LELLKNLPDGPERAPRELDLQVGLAESLRWTKGVGSEETGRALIRAHELCGQVGENTEHFAVLQGLTTHHAIRRRDPHTSRDLAEQLLTLAEAADDPDKLMIAHGVLGVELFGCGELAAALNHFRQAGPGLDWSRTGSVVFYPCVGAWTLWALGYSEQALKWSREAIAAAEALSRPELLANALGLTATFHMFMRDSRNARQCSEAAIAMATEFGLPFDGAYGSFARGWALAREGQLEEGIAEMRRANAAFEMSGFVRARSYGLFAEACAKSEGPGAGLKLLDDGLALVPVIGDRNYEAELHRLKGELLLMRDAGNTAEAERCFRSAIEIARRQGGKALELRATTSLSRLLPDTGRRDEARAMLGEIYNWFTEGFDTADLKDAKSLLDELA